MSGLLYEPTATPEITKVPGFFRRRRLNKLTPEEKLHLETIARDEEIVRKKELEARIREADTRAEEAKLRRIKIQAEISEMQIRKLAAETRRTEYMIITADNRLRQAQHNATMASALSQERLTKLDAFTKEINLRAEKTIAIRKARAKERIAARQLRFEDRTARNNQRVRARIARLAEATVTRTAQIEARTKIEIAQLESRRQLELAGASPRPSILPTNWKPITTPPANSSPA